MRTYLDPTQVERLRALSNALRRVYPAEPAQAPDEIAEKLRRLKEAEDRKH